MFHFLFLRYEVISDVDSNNVISLEMNKINVKNLKHGKIEHLNNASSVQTRLIKWYSNSTEDNQIIKCLLDFHDIRLPLNIIYKPLQDLPVIGQAV